MGAMNAEGMANAVREGLVGLRPALHHHLTANHYPPHDPSFIPVAIEAIIAGQDEDFDRLIDLPAGVTYRDGRTSVEAWRLIESLHLDPFLVTDDGADDLYDGDEMG